MSLECWGSKAGAHTVSCRLPPCGHLVNLSGPTSAPVLCGACGDTDPIERGFVDRDYVPSADLTWPGASFTSSKRLRRELQQQSGTALHSVDDLVAAISTPTAHHISLRDSHLSAHAQPTAETSFLVWRASTTGCEVHGGTVELPEGGVLLLAGHGAHFHGTTFRGGVIMCAGFHYSGTFQSCTFTATAFYAVHGAAVTLCSCTITRAHIALTLSGSATHATLTDTVLCGCHVSAIVDAGASMLASSCSLMDTNRAVVVTGRGSHATLQECAVRGGPADGQLGDTGVTVRLGAAILRDCTLAHFYSSMHVEGGTAEAHGVVVVTSVHCIVATRRARALVRECDLRVTTPAADRTEPAAILAYGTAGSRGRACVQAERSAVHHTTAGAHAVTVDHSSAVSATLCRFDTSGGVAVVGLRQHGGRAVLSYCTGTSPRACLIVYTPTGQMRVVGGQYGGSSMVCTAGHGAKLTAVGCVFRGRRTETCVGVVHVDCAHARLHRCRILDGATGIYACESNVSVSSTTVRDMWSLEPGSSANESRGDDAYGTGLTCMAGQMAVRHCRVQRCAVGVEARGDDDCAGMITLDSVRIEDCAAGVKCRRQSAAKLTGCAFRGLKGLRGRASPELPLTGLRQVYQKLVRGRDDTGVSLLCVRATIQDCSFEGFSIGIHVGAGAADVPVRRCVLRSTSDRCVGLLTCGKVAVEDCEFHGVEGLCGHMLVARGAAVAAVRRSSFNTAVTTAILCEAEATATVVDSVVSGACERALSVQHTAHLAVQDCSVTDAETAVHVIASGCKLSAKRATLQAVHENVLIEAASDGDEPEQGTGRTSVKLVESSIRGAVRGVLVAEGAVDLAVLRCQISAPDIGIYLTGPVMARVKGGSIHDCTSGVLVGMAAADQLQTGPCCVCGVAEPEAMHAAVRAGVAAGSGGGPPATARCTHEGALAELRMADCEVVRCSSVGVRVSLNGRFGGDGVTARDCGAGFGMEYNRVRSSFAGCRAVRCAVGARGWQRLTADGEPTAVPVPEVEVLCGDAG